MTNESAVSTESVDSRVDNVMDILSKDPELQDDEDESNTSTNASDPAGTGETEQPNKDAIGEDQDKTIKAKGVEQPGEPAAIEAPVSWPTDDKEAFKSLPTWAQERIVARENEREAFVSERSRTIAAREKDLNDTQARTTQAQQAYLQEVGRLGQIAATLLPAKFADIKTEADYLAMKSANPARAAEFEAFTQVLTNANKQAATAQQARFSQHLDNEFTALKTKFPEFADPVKGPQLLDSVRQFCVDNYGFTPQEVSIISEHRHIPIVRDAMAWRAHQAALKTAQGKKVPTGAPKVLQQNAAQTGASISNENKQKVLSRASKAPTMREKADAIASLL